MEKIDVTIGTFKDIFGIAMSAMLLIAIAVIVGMLLVKLVLIIKKKLFNPKQERTENNDNHGRNI